MQQSRSQIVLAFCFLAALAFVCQEPRWEKEGPHSAISYDVSGYYWYLPSFLIYKDPAKQKFAPQIIEKYNPQPEFHQAYLHKNGNYIMKYSAGMALLYSPWFATGHLIAKIGGYPADGFSLPYDACLLIGSVLVALLGLFMLRSVLRQFYEDKIVAWVIALVFFGTHYFLYATHDAAMPHSYLFTLQCFILYCTIHWYRQASWRYSIGIGIGIGLVALARPTELLMAFIPIFWAIHSKISWGERRIIWQKNWQKLALAVFIVALIGSIQLVYWKIFAGTWLEYSYQDQGFSFLNPHILDFTFSYRKGWLIYTPLMAFTIWGFRYLYQQYPKIFWGIAIYCFLHYYIAASWDVWAYGGGFGQRTMIQAYPCFAFALAALLKHLQQQKWSWVIHLLLMCCVVLNLFQIWQTRQPYLFETENMNKTFFWKVFGKTKAEMEDQLLLDINHEFTGEPKNLLVAVNESYEEAADTNMLSTRYARTGQYATFSSPEQEFSVSSTVTANAELEKKEWIRVSAWFYTPQRTYSLWEYPHFYLKIFDEKDGVKYKHIKPFRIMKNNEWQAFSFEVPIQQFPWKKLQIGLWQAQNRSILYMDDLKVAFFDD